MKKQCFGYVRVSTVKQGEGASLDAQKEAIKRYAQTNDIKVTEWLEEKETAAKQGRPVFNAMIKSLRAGKADGVVMHKIDRSARNFRDWATVGELQDEGIAVHFAAESVDFGSRGGRLTADIQAVIAADYIRNLKEEVRKGQVARLKQGLYPFGAPFGYINTGKGQAKAIDPIRGPYVREMFELYATGQYSIPSLERELARRGYKTVSGHKIHKSKIELILANPFYAGIIQLKKHSKLYNGIHEPLVSPELFRRVQDAKRNRSRRKKTKHNFLYRGLFACRVCKGAMSPERQRGHVYYRCHTKTCPTNSIRQRDLDWCLLRQLSFLQLCPKDQEWFQAKLMRHLSSKSQGPTQDTIQLQLANIDTQWKRLEDGFLEGLFDAETMKKKKASYEFRKLELSKQVRFEQSTEQRQQNAGRFFEHLQSLARTYFFANDGEKRQMLDLLFSNMSVEAKNVDIPTQKWVCWTPDRQSSLSSADRGGKARSGCELEVAANQTLDTLLDAPEVVRLNNLLDPIVERSANEELPHDATPNLYDQAA